MRTIMSLCTQKKKKENNKWIENINDIWYDMIRYEWKRKMNEWIVLIIDNVNVCVCLLCTSTYEYIGKQKKVKNTINNKVYTIGRYVCLTYYLLFIAIEIEKNSFLCINLNIKKRVKILNVFFRIQSKIFLSLLSQYNIMRVLKCHFLIFV